MNEFVTGVGNTGGETDIEDGDAKSIGPQQGDATDKKT